MAQNKFKKFYFLNDDGSKRQPREGDVYYENEYSIYSQWPFFRKRFVGYRLTQGRWIMFHRV